ncbi:hypothetical protein GCM10009733_083260 [Nonomuraea maheshkhaliensis]|uniref:Uncharacterized protein n=1 Tax=Nonomuraea maheshkhaliensis TaxID=419590 RepID=A0ABP4SK50_9ACTN
MTRELKDLAAELAAAGKRARPTSDNAFLHALLSFPVLTGRASIVGFLRHGIENRISADRRASLRVYFHELFAQSLRVKPSLAYDAYRPAVATVPVGYAAYSANLLLLCVLISVAGSIRSQHQQGDRRQLRIVRDRVGRSGL